MSTIPGVPLSGGVRVLIAAKPVDFRAALAKEVLAQDPFLGRDHRVPCQTDGPA